MRRQPNLIQVTHESSKTDCPHRLFKLMVKAPDTLNVFIQIGSKVTCWEEGQGYGTWLEQKVTDLQEQL